MKLCQTCGQPLAEEVRTCPTCGTEVAEGIKFVDDYRILEIVHEGHASILCRALREGDENPVAIRLFTARSGVDDKVARRLKDELEELQKLPEEWFVRHQAIQCSSDGLWYRVSEWLEAESWGDLLASGRLQDPEVAYDLFQRLAAILNGLHKSGHFIPHLILNDILVLKGGPDRIDVKIDYKLSRFLDPKMARPGQMLKNLLVCHPDITGDRPLNFKSDVWSLGRIFIQVLTADLEICDPRPAVKSADLPQGIGMLIRSMLADDPDLRPRSMAEVADALVRLKAEAGIAKTAAPPATGRQIRRLRESISFLGILVGLLAVLGGFLWFQFGREPESSVSILGGYANRYAGSVAFVVVDYRLEIDGRAVYRQRTEGTAFLVDSDGYLLTNRHVACPWLEDGDFYKILGRIRQAGKTPRFDYRMHLWFEGEKAFNRLLGLGDGSELVDAYNLSSSYSRGGQPSVAIAGVAKAPVRTGQVIRSPLRDDFAVLKIDRVPKGLRPLPLDRELDVPKLQRLSPVIALGFPLGSRTQADTINVSVTRGHIRRTFESFFQVDTSIYKGNSGGPIIDIRGKVIGIASAVITDVAVSPLPVITPLSDIGMVLPVNEAADFIQELKAGQVKWNGVIDLSAEAKIKEITAAARDGRWAEALELADHSLQDSDDPSLVLAAGMIHFCTGDLAGAGALFDRSLSIDPEDAQAGLMRYLIDWKNVRGLQSPHLQQLLELDWRAPNEFLGYLGRVLAGSVSLESALDGWGNLNEKGWIDYVSGLRRLEQNRLDDAWGLFEDAALAADQDEWPLYLALSELDRMSEDREGVGVGFSVFRQALKEAAVAREERLKKIAPLATEFENAGTDPKAQQEVLTQILTFDPDNRRLEAILAFYGAMVSDWPAALMHADTYLQFGGREDALRLGTGLLVPGILYHMGQTEAAQERLQGFCRQTKTPWYRSICETLLGERSEAELMEKAGKTPENLLTAHTALGFRAEGRGERTLAMRHYREALGSYLDNWIEYNLARQRFLKLRQEGKP